MNFSDIAKTATQNHMIDYLKASNRPIKGHFSCMSMRLGTPNAHPDNNPSMNYNPHNGTVHCHQCGLTLDLLDLIGIDYNETNKGNQLEIARQLFPDIPKLTKKEEKKGFPLSWNSPITASPRAEPIKIPADEVLKENDSRSEQQIKDDFLLFKVSAENPDRFTEWQKRGISWDGVDTFKLGYESNYPHFHQTDQYKGFNAQVLTIPYLDKEGSGVLRNVATDIDKKDRYDTKGPKQLFNQSAIFNPNDYIFICEGEIDGLSVYETGEKNFLSLGSTSNISKLIDLLNNPDIPEKTLIILLDNDKAGNTATDKIIQALRNTSKFYCYVPTDFYPLGVKDLNEFLLMDKNRLLNSLTKAEKDARNQREADRIEQAETYLRDTSILSFIDDFKSNLGRVDNTSIYPTGFPLIDEIFLNTGLHGQSLIIIGALSSAGKTTFIHQMADQIAESGKDVMIFSLEMSRSELIAKSISRLTYKKVKENDMDMNNAKTVYGVLDGQRYSKYSQDEIDLIYHATEYYKKCIAPHMFVFEGMGNVTVIPAGYDQPSIRERVEQHVKLTGRNPVVIVDYVQILAPVNERASDKQNTDKNVLELKRIARDFNIPVIGISSMNRDSYNKPISMASLKESGALEYSSDVLLGLQFEGQGKSSFNLKEMKMIEPRSMELVLLKNRNGSMSNPNIYCNYYPKFNYFDNFSLIGTTLEEPGKNANSADRAPKAKINSDVMEILNRR